MKHRLISIVSNAFLIAGILEASILGDVNCDGVVDLLDIEPFVDAITTGTFSVKSDVNEDQVVDLLDVAPFVAILLAG